MVAGGEMEGLLMQNIRSCKFHDGGSLGHERSGWPKGKFSFFAPHRILVQKVETTSIMPHSGQVSPPPPTRITIPYMFPT